MSTNKTCCFERTQFISVTRILTEYLIIEPVDHDGIATPELAEAIVGRDAAESSELEGYSPNGEFEDADGLQWSYTYELGWNDHGDNVVIGNWEAEESALAVAD